MASAKTRRSARRSSGALKRKRVNLNVSDMAHGGYALARYRGKPALLPYALPGETVRAEITETRASLSFARGKQLIAASADRIAPSCRHYGPGRCWGCHFQHTHYAAQLLLKQDVLADQLSRQGKLPDALIDAVMRPVLPAPEEWEYQSRLRLSREGDGAWGLPRQEKRRVQAISECLIAHPDLLEALGSIDFDYPEARSLTLQRGSDGAIMLIIGVDAEEAPELHTDLPYSVNLILPDNQPVNLIGDSHSRFHVNGRDFRVTAGSFFRPNIGGIQALMREVEAAAALTGEQRVLDLYGGVGVFSAGLAENARQITLVDSYPPAVTDAETNLAHLDHIDIIEGGVEAALQDLIARRESVDVALVDPPGRGLGKAVIGQLANLGLRRLVYVSGEPATLARDSRDLLDAGFQLELVQPLDLAPQTYFITAVARFTR